MGFARLTSVRRELAIHLSSRSLSASLAITLYHSLIRPPPVHPLFSSTYVPSTPSLHTYIFLLFHSRTHLLITFAQTSRKIYTKRLTHVCCEHLSLVVVDSSEILYDFAPTAVSTMVSLPLNTLPVIGVGLVLSSSPFPPSVDHVCLCTCICRVVQTGCATFHRIGVCGALSSFRVL